MHVQGLIDIMKGGGQAGIINVQNVHWLIVIFRIRCFTAHRKQRPFPPAPAATARHYTLCMKLIIDEGSSMRNRRPLGGHNIKGF